ncbi:heparinase II/III family protein [Anaerobacillus sp. CMMVII]|uniref:heparinase II/III-family protein n=1 Tax=Anaerobacillus sp. CMMVII TaxID=2755588 RepID=UPI0021B73DA9|nr:heparinase II/III-family protein [Anaerobacillus sp. CMMVII]MCT8140287.1 heparinase II/III family protein [Anaerobacillus sp. CMMVII]
MFDRKDFKDFSESFTIDRKVIAHMVKDFKVEPGVDQSRSRWIFEVDFDQLKEVPFIKTEFLSGGGNLLDRLEGFSYPEFGLYIYKSTQLYLAIRCGSNGQNGNGGHAHNDQLSIELTINGKDIIKDPGTYLYTPLPEKRNLFRSTKSHFTPQCPGKEQNSWVEGLNGLFHLKNEAQAKCLHFSEQGFIGVHYGFGFPFIAKLHSIRIE